MTALELFRYALGAAFLVTLGVTVRSRFRQTRAAKKLAAETALKLENDKLRVEIGHLKAHIRMVETVVAGQNIPKLDTFAKPGNYKWRTDEWMRSSELQSLAMQQNATTSVLSGLYGFGFAGTAIQQTIPANGLQNWVQQSIAVKQGLANQLISQ